MEKQTEDMPAGWKNGAVFEKRYLLGALYCIAKEGDVWQVYDHVLEISCFALRLRKQGMPEAQEKSALRQAAKYLENAENAGGSGWQGKAAVILALKKLGGKITLLFSMKETEGGADIMKACLRAAGEPVDEEARVRYQPEAAVKHPRALPQWMLLDGRYRILECIGAGGFGMIYLCHDEGLQRFAAVKEYFPEKWAEREETYVAVKESKMMHAYRCGMQAFYQEGQMQARFIHTPHIPAVYDIFEGNDTVYLAMEYISGISIGREMRLRNYRPYTPQEMLERMLPVMEAAKALHEKQIVHSDISPANILRSEDGEIFLVDMGAAKDKRNAQAVLGVAFLKTDYAAPEQYQTARLGRPVDEGAWTDVYAIGAVMYYLLTGQRAPDVRQRLESKKSVVELPGKYRLKYAGKWKKILNHAMALEIRERISSIEELEAAVKK